MRRVLKQIAHWFALTIVLCCFCSEASAQESFVANDAILKIHEAREVPSKVSGVILKSNIREGTLVKSDQLLMEIDSRLAKLNLDKLDGEKQIASLEAASTVEIEFMKKSVEVAKAELARALQSNKRLPGAVPSSEIDQLTLVAERAVAEKKKTAFDMKVKGMQTAIRQIELNIGKRQLADHRIQSPISGKVVEVYRKEGEWVNASEPVAKVVQLNRLRTEIKVPASIALNELVGTKAVFTPASGILEGETFEGTVEYVNPEANPINRKMKVWVVIENKDLKLVPGLVGNVELIQATGKPKPVETTSSR